MFDLTVTDKQHADLRLQRHGGARRPGAVPARQRRCAGARSWSRGSGAASANTAAWIKLTSNDTVAAGLDQPAPLRDASASTISWSRCRPASRTPCMIGGVATPTFGEPTLRSIDAGASFSGFGTDAQNPRNSSHVDVRAIVFHPRDPNIAFVGSDGGVVRNDGTFTNISNRCQQLFNNAPQCSTLLPSVPTRLHFLNKRAADAAVLQHRGRSARAAAAHARRPAGQRHGLARTAPARRACGRALFPFGDGTSAIRLPSHAAGRAVRELPEQPLLHQLPQRRSRALGAHRRSDSHAQRARHRSPRRPDASSSRSTRSTPTRSSPAFQHVWRTKNNGGSQAALEASCRFRGGSAAATCGDWVPLGVAFPFAARHRRRSPRAASRRSDERRSTARIAPAASSSRPNAPSATAARCGRPRASAGCSSRRTPTPRAPTSTSRASTRPSMPNRFVTRIVPDRADPNVALISYSGFNALTPSTPGTCLPRRLQSRRPDARRSRSLDVDLGDLPINTLAVDDLRGDIYAGTDFGPIVLRKGRRRGSWRASAFPEALMVDLEFVPDAAAARRRHARVGDFFFDASGGWVGSRSDAGSRAVLAGAGPSQPAPRRVSSDPID